jgi:drug/metabolite transporter (DMT)-like permease
MIARVLEWKKRAGVAFWRIADKRIPKEWLLLAIGGVVLLVYVFVLFFGTRPRK